MRFHRGTSPVLYHLHQGEAPIGAVIRDEDDRIMLSLGGFHSSDAAASAAWAAHSGRVAYETQLAGAGAVRGAGLCRQMAHWERLRYTNHSRLESKQWQHT